MRQYYWKNFNSSWGKIDIGIRRREFLHPRTSDSVLSLLMSFVEVKIINHSGNLLPEYATPGSSGMDIRANLEVSKILQPLERTLIPTGLFIEIPQGYEMQIRPRSGLAIKHGITCLNSPGTIDSDYRGEIKIILINLSQEEQVIHHGDRIAQMVVQKVEKIKWHETEELQSTVRNVGGFGHTGKQ